MFDLMVLIIGAVSIGFIFLLGISQLRRRPIVMRLALLNFLFLGILLPVYLSVLIFSFRHGQGMPEYLFGVFNPALFLMLVFLYLLKRYYRSLVIYNSDPLETRGAAREVLEGRGWKYEEKESSIEIRRPEGKVSFVNQWPGVSIIHSDIPQSTGFEGELLRKLKETRAVPNLFSGIMNLLMAIFLLGFFLMVIL
ncbi:MAG: hypothetical protein DRN28_04490 [Thermoplasmata archaeon]|nr:MAG: hypothetical protein DRN28_04490 [Thermoplasmata archaeon]